jgi:hypothetical protein
MKNFLFCIIIGWSGVISVMGAETVTQLQSQMGSADAQIRASAIKQFIHGLNPSQPQPLTEALPIFVSGLSDSDSKVRESAVKGVLIIAEGTMRVQMPPNPNLPDLTADPKVQKALLAAMSDSDPIVRQAAIQAYSLTYKLTPDVEQQIIDTFNSYQQTPGQPDDRFALLGSLVNDRSPSPVATNFIVQKIDDPKYGTTALQSLGALKTPPPDVLPKLLSEAGQHHLSEDRKSALKRAAKAYGPNAQAQLEQALANPR